VIEALPNAPGGRMFMSPDGDRLYFLGGDRTAREYDLQNATIAQHANVGVSVINNDLAREVVVLNDGRGLAYGEQVARLSDFRSDARQTIQAPDLLAGSSAISPDHGRVLVAGWLTTADVFSLDASTGTFTRFPPQTDSSLGPLHAYEIAMDRHATRTLVRNRVFDANHALLGSLTDWISTDGAVFSPDGTRGYVVFSWSSSRNAELNTFDLSGASSFPRLGPPVTVASECTLPGVAITPDGQTLFIVCDQKFIVRPTS
jgi:WD40 repeat protein